MESILKIEHRYTPFYKRVRYFILIWIGIIATFGVFSLFPKRGDLFETIVIIGVPFGLFFFIKIFRNRFYLFKFYCDSQNVKIAYLNVSKESFRETTIENVDILLMYTASRNGFDFEILFVVDELEFRISRDFDWNFKEMKMLFEFIKFHKKEEFTKEEKFAVRNIENYLKKNQS
jgi:hypothetical protein